tara:strand:+ start:139 stop:1188 length:1050 start_codon:yes stop_codon:yes gene_type:complete
MSYIGTEPKDIRSFGRTKFDYTATQGQTAFTGADDDGKVLAFTVGQIEVYVNGILMDDSDFTTTGTGTVTLASAANLNDVINIVSFETNIPDSNYVPATGGTFTGTVTASNGLTVDDDGATPLTVDRATTDGTVINVQKNGTTVGSIGTIGGDTLTVGSGDTGLLMNQTNDEIIPWNVSSNAARDTAIDLGDPSHRFRDFYLSGGVYLGGTGAANKLEDVEEGNWTPSLNVGSAVAYQNQWYVKIGKLVTCYFYLYNWSNYSNSSQIKISGLPFAFETAHESYFNVSVLGVPSLPTSIINVNGRVGQTGSNTLGLELSYPTQQSVIMSYSQLGTGNTHISATFSYITAA